MKLRAWLARHWAVAAAVAVVVAVGGIALGSQLTGDESTDSTPGGSADASVGDRSRGGDVFAPGDEGTPTESAGEPGASPGANPTPPATAPADTPGSGLGPPATDPGGPAATPSPINPEPSDGSTAPATRIRNTFPGEHNREGAERAAKEYAVAVKGVPIRDGDWDDPSRYCPGEQLQVSWSAPRGTYKYGAYMEPLGPPPTSETQHVNGVVLCEGSRYAYMGFEARWLADSKQWEIYAVPGDG